MTVCRGARSKVRASPAVYSLIQIKHYGGSARTVRRMAAARAGARQENEFERTAASGCPPPSAILHPRRRRFGHPDGGDGPFSCRDHVVGGHAVLETA